jgi:4-hydroxy-tetrahydrodipicolinate synthase
MQMKLQGVWLPIITPFVNNVIDFESYEDLLNHYILKGISGLIPLGTTGESPCITEIEFEKLIDRTLIINNDRVPIFIGLGGNYTNNVLNKLKIAEKYKIDGILSVCPYYNRPDQNGLYQHFLKISEATDLKIIIYNIPYRTGVNLQNHTLLKLAEQANIIGTKDSCGDIKQTLELLAHKPHNFSVLTGEDVLFYTNIVNGGDGGILAAAHIQTDSFINVFNRLQNNDFQSTLQEWRKIEATIPLFFEEPNPGPIKYVLNQLGIIKSDETRLPLTQISESLKNKLDHLITTHKK